MFPVTGTTVESLPRTSESFWKCHLKDVFSILIDLVVQDKV